MPYKTEKVECAWNKSNPEILDKMLNGAEKNGWRVVAITPITANGYLERLLVTFEK